MKVKIVAWSISIIILMIFTSVLLDNKKMKEDIVKLRQQIKELEIDSTSLSYYFIKADEAYKNDDWNSVTTNAFAYEDKAVRINEPVNPVIYLYSSYAYYKLYKAKLDNNTNTLADLNLLDSGLIAIEKYLSKIQDKPMPYFIKGLLLLDYENRDEQYVKKMDQAFISFEKSKKFTNDVKQLSNTIYHMGFALYKKGLYYKGIQEYGLAIKSFKEADKLLNNSSHENAKVLIKGITILIKQCEN